MCVIWYRYYHLYTIMLNMTRLGHMVGNKIQGYAHSCSEDPMMHIAKTTVNTLCSICVQISRSYASGPVIVDVRIILTTAKIGTHISHELQITRHHANAAPSGTEIITAASTEGTSQRASTAQWNGKLLAIFAEARMVQSSPVSFIWWKRCPSL